jgi:hypothetical protein
MYSPNYVPNNPDELPDFLRSELSEIQKAWISAENFLELRVLTAPPARLRPGMLIYADGVDWNPSSGEGIYRRDAANANWVFLG